MPTGYHLSNLRTLLTAGFTAEELRQFCFDTPEFRPVYDQLAANTGKADIIARLLEFAEHKAKVDLLLVWAEQTNPAKYAEHQPYRVDAPSTAGTSQPLVPPPRSLRVFLCHASGDKPAVRELYQRLRDDGFDPWLDEEELLPGQDWDYEIRQAVRRVDVVLVCFSQTATTKAGYVQKEIKFVLDVADQQPEGAIFLIPLRLEPCDVPDRLSRWHWANLFEARGYERLLKALRRRAETLGVHVTLRPPDKPERDPKKPPWGTIHGHPALSTLSTPPDRLTITTPIHLELIRIPAGEFLMGSDPRQDKDARPDEQPQHRVYLSEYYIGKYPITNAQYAAFVKATKHEMPDHWKNGQIPKGKENHPVVYVTWDDAAAFCAWLSRETGQPFRLPTEAEWEKAARGPSTGSGDGRIYPWGNPWDKTKLNSADGGPGDTTPVGKYSPGGDSPYGVADMAGNVWEWCADWYDAQAYQHRATGEVRDPVGPDQGNFRVLRGGAFYFDASWARCAARVRYYWRWGRVYGLRVVVGGPFPSGL